MSKITCIAMFVFSFCLFCTVRADNILFNNSVLVEHKDSGKLDFKVSDQSLKVALQANSSMRFSLCLNEKWRYLYLSMKMKSTELVQGNEGWKNGRLALRFFDASGKPVGAWPDVFWMKGTNDWTLCRRIYTIPENAALLEFSPLHAGSSGTVEFSDISLSPLTDLESIDRDALPPNGQDKASLWSMDDAFKQLNSMRENICLNGLWQFKEIKTAGAVPADGSGWGYFKVPGSWPGMESSWHNPGNAQKIYRSELAVPELADKDINMAWYRRTLSVPSDWKGRKIALDFGMIQSCARIFIDGAFAVELYYPGGFVDLSGKLIPGRTHELAILVTAKPDASSGSVFMAPGRLVEVKNTMKHRGITGDVYLRSFPAEMSINDVHVITSFRKKNITLDLGILPSKSGTYYLEAEVYDGAKIVKSLKSGLFNVNNEELGREIRKQFDSSWSDPKLWDIDCPENLYTVKCYLKNDEGKLLDEALPESFGFREFWIEARDFYLNGSRIHLRSLVGDSMTSSADRAFKPMVLEGAKRIKAYGFNHLIADNYSFAPGAVGYLDSFPEECSKAGILSSISLPHCKDFSWNLDKPENAEKYRLFSSFIIRKYQNVPGVVLYAMNHNATGYGGDQNPDSMKGSADPELNIERRDAKTAAYRKQALKAAEIAKSIDPSRPAYHHESGSLGDMYTINCYLNWSPRQERSDWFETWENYGNKPLFIVEWGIPHIASWSSMRGPVFIWTGKTPQCVWLNEYNAAILGEKAYASDPAKNRLYQAHEKYCKNNQSIYFGALSPMGTINDVHALREWMIKDNFKSMRARGVSAFLPWDQDTFWALPPGSSEKNKWKQCFENLKYPGPVPDTVGRASSPFASLEENPSLTLTGKAAVAASSEILAWIGGRKGDFTEKGHNFFKGESVKKQLIFLNDSRRERLISYIYSIPELGIKASGTVSVKPGERKDVPFEFAIPAACAAGKLTVNAEFNCESRIIPTDSFEIDLFSKPESKPSSSVGLFDPEGSTEVLLGALNIPFTRILSQEDIDKAGIIIIGRKGLDKFPFKLSDASSKGRKILIMEQSKETLERLGFRSNEHGLRDIFAPDGRRIHDWRGSSTLYPDSIAVKDPFNDTPQWDWNGFTNTRVWRSGNRGNVNSVLLEKPHNGDFLPLYHAGFDLQYAPALDLRSGNLRLIMSQLDISGRTEADPEALLIFHDLIMRLDRNEEHPVRKLYYSGNEAGAGLLEALNLNFSKDAVSESENSLLVLAAGTSAADLLPQIEKGLDVLALGLNSAEISKAFPGLFTCRNGKYYSDIIPDLHKIPELRGTTDADLHWRNSVSVDMPDSKAMLIKHYGKGRIILLQIVPWLFPSDELQFRTTVRRNVFLISRLIRNLGGEEKSSLAGLFDGAFSNGAVWCFPDTWLGLADPEKKGSALKYFSQEFSPDSKWRALKVPGSFESQFTELSDYDGQFWYRLNFQAPDFLLNHKKLILNIGPVDDESEIWLNGHFIGKVDRQTNPDNYWNFNRKYEIESSLLKQGDNSITVLCNDLRGNGGIMGTPEIRVPQSIKLYYDSPESGDDPYRYIRW